jgi:hypothetical protein
MKSSMQKFFNEYGIGVFVILLIVAYGVCFLYNYLSNKGKSGSEKMENNSEKPNNQQNTSPQPSEVLGQNATYASANGIETSTPGLPSSCAQPNIQNPSDLLPKDNNSEWSQLNPTGQGSLSDVNLLKSGYHMGIDTIGQSLRNANQQLRSDPVIPQVDTGPWNKSTIEHDYMRPPFEIGQGGQ